MKTADSAAKTAFGQSSPKPPSVGAAPAAPVPVVPGTERSRRDSGIWSIKPRPQNDTLQNDNVRSNGAASPTTSPIGAPSHGWPKRVGVMNDYVRIPYANGSSFASQFIYRELVSRGHEVTVVGPRDPEATADQLPPRHVLFPALPMRAHPGLYLPVPSRKSLNEIASKDLDILLGQAGSELIDLGVWLRHTHNVPFLAVNTVHLPSAYNVILPDKVISVKPIHQFFENRVVPWVEHHSAKVYNGGDGLIVLSKGLKQYWRDRGVTVPIHVIPRAVEPKIFDSTPGEDPFDASALRGGRLLVVCRHTREKSVARLIELFAKHVVPNTPNATLTLVGDGPDHDSFVELAKKLGVEDRTFFPGEFSVTDIPTWYHHADVFVYTSLSETYGQVVTEAMWSGLPVVAFEDGMGVSHQIDHGQDGFLIPPGPDEEESNRRFAHEVSGLLKDPTKRHWFASKARRSAQDRAMPARCIERYYEAFASAKEHCAQTADERKTSGLASKWASQRILNRWTSVQLAAAGMGLLRAPVTLNRHGRSQPNWDLEPKTA